MVHDKLHLEALYSDGWWREKGSLVNKKRTSEGWDSRLRGNKHRGNDRHRVIPKEAEVLCLQQEFGGIRLPV
jgi:hypothetical protein